MDKVLHSLVLILALAAGLFVGAMYGLYVLMVWAINRPVPQEEP